MKRHQEYKYTVKKSHKDIVRRCPLQVKARSLKRNPPYWHLDLGLPACRTAKTMGVAEATHLRYFTTA